MQRIYVNMLQGQINNLHNLQNIADDCHHTAKVYSASGVVWWRVSCSTLYSEGCTAVGGGSHTIASTASVESFVDRPHC